MGELAYTVHIECDECGQTGSYISRDKPAIGSPTHPPCTECGETKQTVRRVEDGKIVKAA